jgi:hypothetical protein
MLGDNIHPYVFIKDSKIMGEPLGKLKKNFGEYLNILELNRTV